MPISAHPATIIRGAREALGMSRAQLADALGCSMATVKGMETGRTEPAPHRWPALRDLLVDQQSAVRAVLVAVREMES